MPYIVRFFLQKEDEIGTKEGSECSGTIIDNHWIVTSFACCENIAAFKLLDFGRKRMTIVKQGQGSTVLGGTTGTRTDQKLEKIPNFSNRVVRGSLIEA